MPLIKFEVSGFTITAILVSLNHFIYSGSWNNWTNCWQVFRDQSHKLFMNSLFKTHQNSFYSNFDSNNPIRLQFCTCHDSTAVMTCAKLWPDQIITHHTTNTILMRFRFWAHKLFVKQALSVPYCLWSVSFEQGFWEKNIDTHQLLLLSFICIMPFILHAYCGWRKTYMVPLYDQWGFGGDYANLF